MDWNSWTKKDFKSISEVEDAIKHLKGIIEIMKIDQLEEGDHVRIKNGVDHPVLSKYVGKELTVVSKRSQTILVEADDGNKFDILKEMLVKVTDKEKVLKRGILEKSNTKFFDKYIGKEVKIVSEIEDRYMIILNDNKYIIPKTFIKVIEEKKDEEN